MLYPFSVGEGIWDLGEGEFASSVHLHTEIKPVIVTPTLQVGKNNRIIFSYIYITIFLIFILPY